MEPQERKFSLYILKEPDLPDVIRYVGITSQKVSRRAKAHSYQSGANPHKWNWIKKLERAGKVPVCDEILTGMTIDEACSMEKGLIGSLRELGHKLVNISIGGIAPCAGRAPSTETREKLRVALLGRQFSQETRLKISRALKGRKQSPEWVLAGRLARKMTPKTRARISAAGIGRRHSTKTRRQMSASQRVKCTARRIEFNGKTMTVRAWSDEIGVKASTVRYRLRSGWSIAEALACR